MTSSANLSFVYKESEEKTVHTLRVIQVIPDLYLHAGDQNAEFYVNASQAGKIYVGINVTETYDEFKE